MITIKPEGGLCNRLRALGSALALSRHINTKLHLIWQLDSVINCPFEQLFKTPQNVTVSDSRYSYSDIFIIRKIQKLASRLRLSYKYDKVLSSEKVAKHRTNNSYFEELTEYQSVYISSYSIFYPYISVLNEIKPVPQIQEIINSYTQQFNEFTVGIHIRRTDNEMSIAHSPTDEFVRLMEVEMQQDPNVRFFLATDSVEVESQLSHEFPGKIITHKKNLDRKISKAAQDALVDLMCLSGTKKIIGSYHSSFSRIAAQINELDLHVVNVI